MIGQFEMGRSVSCPPIGTFGYKHNTERSKIIYLLLSEEFCNTYGLMSYLEGQENCQLDPAIRVNYTGVSKTGSLDKSIVTTAITNIWIAVGELLSENFEIEIDLGQLGKLLGSNRIIKAS